MASDYAGFGPADLAAYFGIPSNTAQALIDWQGGGQLTDAQIQALQTLGPTRLGPSGGGPNAAGDITWGLQHLAEHSAGSHYHGDFTSNPIANIGLNIATGGMYGLGKAAYNVASGNQDVIGGVREGMNQLGPWGSATYGIPKYGPQIAESGNLVGAGAGIGGAFGAPFAGAIGGQMAGQLVPPAGGMTPGAPEGGAGSGGYGGPTGPGGLTPQQLAALSAMNSQAHRGLAPSFEARMKGQSPGPGISGDAFSQFNQV